MSSIRKGQFTAYFLFDVSESIALGEVARHVSRSLPARIPQRSTAPRYVQYQQPPLAIDGESVGSAEADGFSVRFKVFDYGVISVALTAPLPSAWSELVERAIRWHDDPQLPQVAEGLARRLLERVPSAVTVPHEAFLTEDYLVFAVTEIDGRPTTEALLEAHGAEIAAILRGEREPLSRQEREEVLRHRISYFERDVVVPTWNAAFVYDTEAGTHGVAELLEFANSQLLEFRYYDGLLDRQLAGIYAELQMPGWFRGWGGRRYTRPAQRVHSLFIDVNELTDRTENALKIAGDIYAARVLALAEARLGLDHWKANVREKLKTLDDIYRFAVEQTSMARGEFLELAIVLILVFELVLFFLGIMR